MNKVYLCIDLKSFYASVECVERELDPFTTNLVVADPSRGNGAICLAVSPHLKSIGVKNRCLIFGIPKDIVYITSYLLFTVFTPFVSVGVIKYITPRL